MKAYLESDKKERSNVMGNQYNEFSDAEQMRKDYISLGKTVKEGVIMKKTRMNATGSNPASNCRLLN